MDCKSFELFACEVRRVAVHTERHWIHIFNNGPGHVRVMAQMDGMKEPEQVVSIDPGEEYHLNPISGSEGTASRAQIFLSAPFDRAEVATVTGLSRAAKAREVEKSKESK